MHRRIATAAFVVIALSLASAASAAPQPAAEALDLRGGEELISLWGSPERFTAVASAKAGKGAVDYFILVPGKRYGPYERVGRLTSKVPNNLDLNYPAALPPALIAEDRDKQAWLAGIEGLRGPFESIQACPPIDGREGPWCYATKDTEGWRLWTFGETISERRLPEAGGDYVDFAFSPCGRHFSALLRDGKTYKKTAMVIDDLVIQLGIIGFGSTNRIGWIGAEPRFYFASEYNGLDHNNSIWYMLRFDPATGQVAALLQDGLGPGLSGAFEPVDLTKGFIPPEAFDYDELRSAAKKKGADDSPLTILRALYGDPNRPRRYALISRFSSDFDFFKDSGLFIRVVASTGGWIMAEDRSWGPLPVEDPASFLRLDGRSEFSRDFSRLAVPIVDGAGTSIRDLPEGSMYGPYKGSLQSLRFTEAGRLAYVILDSRHRLTRYLDGTPLGGSGEVQGGISWPADEPPEADEYWMTAEPGGPAFVWRLGERIAGPFDRDSLTYAVYSPEDRSCVFEGVLGGIGIAYGPFGELRAPNDSSDLSYYGKHPGTGKPIYSYKDEKGGRIVNWGGIKLGKFTTPRVAIDHASGAGLIAAVKGGRARLWPVSSAGKLGASIDMGCPELPFGVFDDSLQFCQLELADASLSFAVRYSFSRDTRDNTSATRIFMGGAFYTGDYDEARGRLVYWDPKKRAIIEAEINRVQRIGYR